MLPKLKIALILFVIGAVSGAGIVGVNSFTEDIIEANRLREEHEAYFDIFGLDMPEEFDVDEEPQDVYCRREVKGYDADRETIGEIVFFCVADEDVYERAVAYDKDGNRLGQVFRVDDVNNHGEISTLVAFDGNFEILDVRIVHTTNTPNYVQRIEDDYLGDFAGQDIRDVDFYDGSTGATITYNSIRQAVNLTAANAEADRVLDAYRKVYPEADNYERAFDYTLGCIRYRDAVYDIEGNLLGHVYMAQYDDEGHDPIDLVVAVEDETFKDVVVAREDQASETLMDALDKYRDYTGEHVGDIDIAAYDDTVYDSSITHLLEQSFVRCVEDDEQRELREFFRWATRTGEVETIDNDYVESYQPYYDEDDELLGHVYIGEMDTSDLTDDYSGGLLRIKVSIDLDGLIHNAVIEEINESNFANDLLEEEIARYRGMEGPMEEEDVSDAFSSATYSGDALNTIIEAIYAHNGENIEEGE